MDLVKIIREVQRKKADRQRRQNQAFCFLCKKQTTLVAVGQAMEFYEMTIEEISQSVAAGAVHRIHNSKGEILICQSSLQQIASRMQITQPLRPEFLQSLEIA